jgi:HSP90 family molecular chaperone
MVVGEVQAGYRRGANTWTCHRDEGYRRSSLPHEIRGTTIVMATLRRESAQWMGEIEIPKVIHIYRLQFVID